MLEYSPLYATGLLLAQLPAQNKAVKVHMMSSVNTSIFFRPLTGFVESAAVFGSDVFVFEKHWQYQLY